MKNEERRQEALHLWSVEEGEVQNLHTSCIPNISVIINQVTGLNPLLPLFWLEDQNNLLAITSF